MSDKENNRETGRDQGADGKATTGPEPDRLKIDGKWEDAVDKALGKEKPAEGWPRRGEG